MEYTPKEEIVSAIKSEVADITTHSKADLKAYEEVDADYMNYSSVARKPFAAKGEAKKDEEPKAPATPGAPKAPGDK